MTSNVSRTSAGELAPDFHYRDKICAVEPYGIDAIPDAERHGKPISQFFIWFAAGMNFPMRHRRARVALTSFVSR
jgi:hypothetical protein